MDKQFRRVLFNHYWWFLPLTAIIAAYLIYHYAIPGRRFEYYCAALAAIAGVFYFVQKQKLDEFKLFSDLFKEFNKRYTDLSIELSRIVKVARESDAVAEEDKVLLCKYYDLCAEEYLFWMEDRIHKDVWKAWRDGIARYLAVGAIKRYFKSEIKDGSYYGLTLTALRLIDE